MFDLHQGFTHDENPSEQPTAGDVAWTLLDAASALGKGKLRLFATQQTRAAGMLAGMAAARVRRMLPRR